MEYKVGDKVKYEGERTISVGRIVNIDDENKDVTIQTPQFTEIVKFEKVITKLDE